MPRTIDLANDIVQYERRVNVYYAKLSEVLENYIPGDNIDVKFKQLIKDMDLPELSDTTKRAQDRFLAIIRRLAQEAKVRADKAATLNKDLVTFSGALDTIKDRFDTQEQDFNTKFGSQSAAMQQLTNQVNALNDQLASAKRKERDEVIVLGTSPLYLLIPVYGPIILAGIDIGVGVDLAKTREAIGGLSSQITAVQHDIDVDQLFMSYYTSGQGMCKNASADIKAVQPLVERIHSAWAAIGDDLDDLANTIMAGTVAKAIEEDPDWFNVSIDLELAGNTWADIAKQADAYRLYAPAKDLTETPTVLAA